MLYINEKKELKVKDKLGNIVPSLTQCLVLGPTWNGDRDANIMLVEYRASVAQGGSKFYQHWFNISC